MRRGKSSSSNSVRSRSFSDRLTRFEPRSRPSAGWIHLNPSVDPVSAAMTTMSENSNSNTEREEEATMIPASTSALARVAASGTPATRGDSGVTRMADTSDTRMTPCGGVAIPSVGRSVEALPAAAAAAAAATVRREVVMEEEEEE